MDGAAAIKAAPKRDRRRPPHGWKLPPWREKGWEEKEEEEDVNRGENGIPSLLLFASPLPSILKRRPSPIVICVLRQKGEEEQEFSSSSLLSSCLLAPRGKIASHLPIAPEGPPDHL